MAERICEVHPEVVALIEEFLVVFHKNVEELISGGAPLSEYSGEKRKDILTLAREAALDSDFRFRNTLKPAWEARMKQMTTGNGAKPAETPGQKIGAYMQGKIGGVVSSMLDEVGDGKRRGFTGVLTRLADLVDIIYPDDVMAELFDLTDDGVSTARNTIRGDGYIIERIDGDDVGDTTTTRSWWRVVARPAPEPEPDPVDPRLTEAQRVFPMWTPEQLGFLIAAHDGK